jgi:hypothetical protein
MCSKIHSKIAAAISVMIRAKKILRMFKMAKFRKVQHCAVTFYTGYSALASGLAVQLALRANIQIERSFRVARLTGKWDRAWQRFLFLFLHCAWPLRISRVAVRQLAPRFRSAQRAAQPSLAAYCLARLALPPC